MKVDETGAGYLHFVYVRVIGQRFDDACRDIPGTFARGLRKPHGYIARKVAMAGVSCSLDRALYRKLGGSLCHLGQIGERVGD